MATKVFWKPGEFPAFWNSQISKRHKMNNINSDLHQAFKIASDFDAEVYIITKKLVTSKRKIKTNQLYLTGGLEKVKQIIETTLLP